MSSLVCRAHITNWAKIRQYLRVADPDYHQSEASVDSMSDDRPGSAATSSTDWLNDCLVAVSPDCDTLVIAHSSRAVAVSVTRGVTAQFDTQSEDITATTFIPLVSSRKSEPNAYDWTAVVLCTTGGHVLYHSADTGRCVLRQRFSRSPVCSVDLQFNARITGQQEFSVMHSDGTLVTLEGLALMTALCVARTRTGAGQTGGPDVAFQKWRLSLQGTSSQSYLSDFANRQHASLGPALDDVFSQMSSASMDRFTAQINAVAPRFASYLVTSGSGGSGPFLTNYFAREDGLSGGFIREVLGSGLERVRSAVESSAPSTVGTWGSRGLSWVGNVVAGTAPSSNVPGYDVPPTDLPQKCLLIDSKREGQRLYPLRTGASSSLCALTDSLGRVMLLDTSANLCSIRRVWKGYRDAQCAWLRVPKQSGSSSPSPLSTSIDDQDQVATFLVIYAPRRGLLEVWSAQSGPRVAAFSVDRNGRLVFNIQLVLGAPSVCYTPVPRFIDSTGRVYSLTVPFRCALQDESAQSLHDAALLSDLGTRFADLPGCEDAASILDDIAACVFAFQTERGLRVAVERIVQLKAVKAEHVDCMLDHCATALKKLLNSGGQQVLNNSLLLHEINMYQQLANVFVILQKQYAAPTLVSASSPELSNALMAQLFHLDLDKFGEYLQDLKTNLELRASSESLPETDPCSQLSCSQFLSAFQIRRVVGGRTSQKKDAKFYVSLRDAIPNPDLYAVSDYILRPFLTLSDPRILFEHVFPLLKICRCQLARLLTSAWMFCPHSYSVYPPTLYTIALGIARYSRTKCIPLSSADSPMACPQSPEPWRDVVLRAIMAEHICIAESFTLCIVVRAVVLQLHRDGTTFHGGFERVSEITEAADSLICMLHLLVRLHSLRTALHVSSAESSIYPLSPQAVLDNGRHYIVECVSQCIVLSELNLTAYDVAQVYGAEKLQKKPKAKLEKWKTLLLQALADFPISLSPDVLLINCAWECALHWSRDRDDVTALVRVPGYIADVSCSVLQHGVAFLIWSMHLAEPFQKMAELVEKVAKFPKDRLCRREVGVSEMRLVVFAETCCTLLRQLADANAQYDNAAGASQARSLQVEDFVDNFVLLHQDDKRARKPSQSGLPGGAAKTALYEPCIRQRCGNFFLTKHHFQLAAAVEMQLEQSLKPAKPLSLFDVKGRNAFFVSLDRYPLLPHDAADVDSQTKQLRVMFLHNYLTSLIENTFHQTTECIAKYSKESFALPGLVLELSQLWKISHDSLRCYTITQLYSLGFDAVAEKMHPCVEDRLLLGSELLLTAGERLNHRLFYDPARSNDLQNAVALLSPTLSAWVKSMDPGRLRFTEFSLDSVKTLVTYTLQYLPSVHAQYKFAQQLSELIERLTI